ncbi:major facilitator superfamily protein, putative [Ichthyophthirius multifiliis]|uniref:Major facilitator superfamily protein, putative n=1 Tax=Ichthyophthirius multifiliis TaxID=5932 RepID=G0QLL9_ICHMU|nr:major facilitator superfamily protein, putative [Ichthyophthirius multifiliis]EGR33885.1 major facilitator superfamily protein, putative [Ichthyophthirius multifiliis]|eukprot:XP_004039109.1 major facilitator superfamily protein, putative [Ichthyophthirius multifiliis]
MYFQVFGAIRFIECMVLFACRFFYQFLYKDQFQYVQLIGSCVIKIIIGGGGVFYTEGVQAFLFVFMLFIFIMKNLKCMDLFNLYFILVICLFFVQFLWLSWGQQAFLQVLSLQKKINPNGKYQQRTFCYILQVLFYQEPVFKCGDNRCTEDTGGCDKTSKVDYENSQKSASLEFRLYCEKRNERIYGESLLYFGNLVGLFIFNYISDNYGRLLALISSWILGFIGCISGVLAKSSVFLNLGMLLIGLGMGAFGVISNVYVSEISNKKYGNLYQLVMYLMWSVSEIILYPTQYFLKEWRKQFIYLIFLPSFFIFFFLFFLKESPKFLHTKDHEKTIILLSEISQINGISFDKNKFQLQQIQDNQKNTQYYFWDLFLFKSLRFNTINLCLFSFFIHLQFYGISFILSQIGFDFYSNMLFIGMSEIVAYCFVLSIKNKQKYLKKGCFFSLIISNILFILLSYSSNLKIIQLIFICLIRFSLTFSFAFYILLITHIFPTKIKSTAFGFIVSFGMLGSILSPYAIDFAERIGIFPTFLIGLLGFGGVGGYFGIEVGNESQNRDHIQEIQENIQQQQTIGKKNEQYLEFQNEQQI